MAQDTADVDGLIHVMPDPLANQIAAGEVVQRPASVVKECIENALDAGATSIDVVVKQAGSELIQIIDNGSGMSPHDAELCFRRHATSKIRAVSDLNSIRTLGFRGEALASIAAVAQVELRTKRPGDDAALCVEVEGSEIIRTKPCAGPNGTSISVRNLFYNVPARRTFLKTPATELNHITDAFQKQALANPEVGFKLIHNGNEIYHLPAKSSSNDRPLRQRIIDLLGHAHEDKLLHVEAEHSDTSVDGYVGSPSFIRKNRANQYLFVNDRPVENRYLSHAVKKAFGALLDDGSFPFFALFLRLDPSRVDVNVHPAKEEVKFDDKQGLYAFIREAVREALGRMQTRPEFSRTESSEQDGSTPPRSFSTRSSSSQTVDRRSIDSPKADPFHASSELYRTKDDSFSQHAPKADGRDGEDRADNLFSQRHASAPRDFWHIAQAFILVHEGDAVTVIDQRAAHKRILFEQMLTEGEQNRSTQTLLFPNTVELGATGFSVFESIKEDLAELGFDVEPFGDKTVVIRGIPPGVQEGEAEEVLAGLIQDLRDELRGASRETRARAIAKAVVSRQAIHRETPLERQEIAALLDELYACDMPYIDPHGEPVMIRLGKHDLAEALKQLSS